MAATATFAGKVGKALMTGGGGGTAAVVDDDDDDGRRRRQRARLPQPPQLVADPFAWNVGQVVEVRPRTWAGINRPGGIGVVTRIRSSDGGGVTLDVRYAVGNCCDRNLDPDLVKPHELDRGSRRRSNNNKPPPQQQQQLQKELDRRPGAVAKKKQQQEENDGPISRNRRDSSSKKTKKKKKNKSSPGGMPRLPSFRKNRNKKQARQSDRQRKQQRCGGGGGGEGVVDDDDDDSVANRTLPIPTEISFNERRQPDGDGNANLKRNDDREEEEEDDDYDDDMTCVSELAPFADPEHEMIQQKRQYMLAEAKRKHELQEQRKRRQEEKSQQQQQQQQNRQSGGEERRAGSATKQSSSTGSKRNILANFLHSKERRNSGGSNSNNNNNKSPNNSTVVSSDNGGSGSNDGNNTGSGPPGRSAAARASPVVAARSASIGSGGFRARSTSIGSGDFPSDVAMMGAGCEDDAGSVSSSSTATTSMYPSIAVAPEMPAARSAAGANTTTAAVKKTQATLLKGHFHNKRKNVASSPPNHKRVVPESYLKQAYDIDKKRAKDFVGQVVAGGGHGPQALDETSFASGLSFEDCGDEKQRHSHLLGVTVTTGAATAADAKHRQQQAFVSRFNRILEDHDGELEESNLLSLLARENASPSSLQFDSSHVEEYLQHLNNENKIMRSDGWVYAI